VILLSADQRAIVGDTAEHKVVMAGAGSGKTRVLAAQAEAWQADSAHVAAITFTRRAARELERRLPDAEWGHVGTVHSLAYRLIRGAGRSAWPIDDTDRQLIRRMLRLRAGGTRNVPVLDRLCADYERTYGLVHVEDAVRTAVEALTETGYRPPLTSILWDEHQDSDEWDAALFRVLAPARSLVIGDLRQAIFGFRDASPDYMLARASAPQSRAFTLVVNWRSDRDIVDAANAILPDHPPLLWASSAPGTVETLGMRDGLVDLALRPGSKAMLFRWNRQIPALTAACEAAGVRFRLISRDSDPWGLYPWPQLATACRIACGCTAEWMTDRYGDLPRCDMWSHVHAVAAAAGLHVHGPSSDQYERLLLPAIAYLDWYATRDLQDSVSDDPAEIQIMTVHAAKGLEFDSVALAPGLWEGPWTDDAERRVAYVAATRPASALLRLEAERAPIEDRFCRACGERSIGDLCVRCASVAEMEGAR